MAAHDRHIVPALLSSDRDAFQDGLRKLGCIPGVRRVQIDVVDGRFASPESWPYTEPGAMKHLCGAGEFLPKVEHIEYEIDLMCHEVEHASDAWLSVGASRLTLHAEALLDIGKELAGIESRHCGGMAFDDAPFVTVGLALNMGSPLSLIEPYVSRVDYVQFMGIDRIGKQSQPFNPKVIDRIVAFRKRYPLTRVQVDGGVSLENAQKLFQAGADDLVVGSKIMQASDSAMAMQTFLSLL